MSDRVTASDRVDLSIEEFQRLPDEEGRMELVEGRVVREPPPGAEHGYVGLKLVAPLLRYVEENDLGLVVSMETGFIVQDHPPTVRAPDLAYIRKEHLPEEGIPSGYWPFPPDLAVEVVSPSDRADPVEEKALDYLRCGVGAVWVVHPRSRTVTVYRSREDIELLTMADELDGGNLIPGFRVAVRELFP